MEYDPHQSTNPEDFLLERNPDLLAIAETDHQLRDRLEGVRIARQIAEQSPDNEAMQRLPSTMEAAVREYLEKANYHWQELQDPNQPPA